MAKPLHSTAASFHGRHGLRPHGVSDDIVAGVGIVAGVDTVAFGGALGFWCCLDIALDPAVNT